VVVEFATMTLHPTSRQPLAKIYRPSELDDLLRKYELGGTKDDQIGVGEGTGGGGGQEGGNVSLST
jgi:20S proteasome subunit alpha 3